MLEETAAPSRKARMDRRATEQKNSICSAGSSADRLHWIEIKSVARRMRAVNGVSAGALPQPRSLEAFERIFAQNPPGTCFGAPEACAVDSDLRNHSATPTAQLFATSRSGCAARV
jgi:hypothetical protein